MEEYKTEQVPTESLSLPQADAALFLYKSKFEDNPERIKKLEEVFKVFLDQSLAKTEVYSSGEMGASFPWSMVKMSDLAKELYEKFSDKELPDTLIEDVEAGKVPNIEQEFVFGSAFAYSHGDMFVFAEEAMHQVIKRLPAAIKALKEGKEPEEFEIYTVGMPTNTFGEISSKFAENLKDNSYDSMGRLYSEFVTKKLAPESGSKRSVQLYGISMGGGFAAKVGEKLFESGAVTQGDDEEKPRLQIKSMVPVSLGRSEIKPFQIPAGFAVESIVETITNGSIQKIGEGMAKFQEEVALILGSRGIFSQMSPEQKVLKREALFSIISGLGKGLEIKPEVKLTKIVGLKDLTMYNLGFNDAAEEHRLQNLEDNDGVESLGTNLVPGENENQRTFGVNMRHTIPFFRDSEFRRMQKAAIALEDLKI